MGRICNTNWANEKLTLNFGRKLSGEETGRRPISGRGLEK
jgi:hypothetical protein